MQPMQNNVSGIKTPNEYNTASTTADDFLEKLSAWEKAAPGEDRSVPAARIKEAYEKKLTSLNLASFGTLTSLPDTLPPSLREINLSNCGSLTELPNSLPSSLTDLLLDNCSSLTKLPDSLPPSLVILDMPGCASLTALPNDLPTKLGRLNLSGCTSLAALPSILPASIQVLNISNCTSLMSLPNNLPASLVHFYLDHCSSLTALPAQLPPRLELISMNSCTSLTALPAHLPSALKEINLVNCTLLITLPNDLPSSLITLDLRLCTSMSTLPIHLPTNLQSLYLHNCTSLTALPNQLPFSLTVLNLQNCTSLLTVPAHLPHRLTIVLPDGQRLDPSQHNGHMPPLAQPKNPEENWYRKAGKTEQEVHALKTAWENVKTTSYYAAFETLLKRLAENALSNSIDPQEVVEVIIEVVKSPDARKQIFEAAQTSDQDCHDRPLTLFNTIQSIARFSKLQREGAPITEIFQLAEGMLKIALIDEACSKLMTEQWKNGRRTSNADGTGPNVEEALEVQLALRHQLAEKMGLPFKVKNSLYTQTAQVTSEDLVFVEKYVQGIMSNLSQKVDGLLAIPMWLAYIKQLKGQEIKEIDIKYGALMEGLENAGLSSEEYNVRAKKLVNDRESEINLLVQQATNEVIQKM